MESLLLVPPPKKVELSAVGLTLSAAQQQCVANFTLADPLPSGFTFTTVEAPAAEKYDWYRIQISSAGIDIAAAERNGLFYAMQTLRQILRQRRAGHLPGGYIEDWSDFKVRGVLYDISRDRVPTMPTLKQLIDLWAEWKYNQVQLYTEHSFAYSRHRSVWKDASPLTADELRGIDAYCSVRGIELVPNQNSFGHMERWLQHDEYKYLAESPDGFYDPWGEYRSASSTISPAVDAALPFLSGLYGELLPCFESGYLNIGGDEPWELGKGRSKQICAAEGLDRIYFNFLMKIYRLAKQKGKRVQIYGDIIMKYPHLIKELPNDIVLINWGYEADHPFQRECERIAAAQIPFYVCTGNSAWNSLGGRWENARQNISNGAFHGLKFGAEGFIVSEWGDNGHWQQMVTGLPGFMFGACAAWNASALRPAKNDSQRSQPANYFLTRKFAPELALTVHVFEGNTALAKAAMHLQRIWRLSGVRLHNVSLPAVLMLDPVFPYYRSEYQQFRGYSFEKEIAQLNSVGTLLDRVLSSPGLSSKAALYAHELQLTQRLLRHGCRLGRLQMATQGLTAGEIAAQEREVLAADLEPLIEAYRRLWHRRARPGGLEDSAGRLERLLQSYRIDRR